jgi:hypothetical protein
MESPSQLELEIFDEDDEPRPVKKTDAAALRILAEWVASQDRHPRAGAVIDRGFVVVEADHA